MIDRDSLKEILIETIKTNIDSLGGYEGSAVFDYDKLTDYLMELYRVQSFMNLTAIKSPLDGCLKHIADALTLVPLIPQGARVLDVGTGAGIPALPLAIVRQDLRVTALDSTGKKVNFIKETAEKLGVKNLTAVCGRAEELSQEEERERFDFVTARALARLNVLCELCLPFVKVGGTFISMKGPQGGEELDEADNAIVTLGGRLNDIKDVKLLPLSEIGGEPLERSLIIIGKAKHTPPKYPRSNSIISKKPL